jgi:hypothetical protein
MIDRNSHPVGWAMLLTALEDVQEHIADLVKELESTGDMDDAELSIHLGHVYAHLNRIWHARNEEEGIREDQWSEFSQFPKDVKPVG